MSNLCVISIFSEGRPRCTGLLQNDQIQIYDLYRPGTARPYGAIATSRREIRDRILDTLRNGHKVVISDFKAHLKPFELPINSRQYDVYDLHLPDLTPKSNATQDAQLLEVLLVSMGKKKLYDYHRLLANAAVVYQLMEDRGVHNNSIPAKPIWSLKTFSGRSKATGFPIQGYTDHTVLSHPGHDPKDLLVHFDWISADLRVAAILSGDDRLEEAFLDSDPYLYMKKFMLAQLGQNVDRETCKLMLLRAINSMDLDSVALTKIYPKLGAWVAKCKEITSEPGGYLDTLLKRRFRVAHAKNPLAVLNGVQQGSVAHAMHAVIRNVWDSVGARLIMEGHDSLVVASGSGPAELKATISRVAQIMLHPFEGLLPNNPAFPLKISVGKEWRKWKLKIIRREGGWEYVQKATDPTESDPEGAPPPGQVGGEEEVAGQDGEATTS